ncbi:MAG: hypothetical protein EB060_06410 [Proteobacteria bacterium]|nr:hypothetical protein [Pseudomonadota bacterium]
MLNLMKEHTRLFLPSPRPTIAELLTLRFLTKYTDVASVEELIERSGLAIAEHRLATVNHRDWDIYIRSISPFKNWRALLAEAKREWHFKQRIFERICVC